MEDGKIVLNKSFLYLFPVLYKKIADSINLNYDMFKDLGMIDSLFNTYCYVEGNEQFAISFTKDDLPNDSIDIISNSEFLITNYASEDLITFIFSIPADVKDCYSKFINGKYSRYSDDNKKEITKFISKFLVSKSVPKSEILLSTVVEVMNRSKKRAEKMMDMYGISRHDWDENWEVSSIIDKDKENFILK
jgi:hypothetical protein